MPLLAQNPGDATASYCRQQCLIYAGSILADIVIILKDNNIRIYIQLDYSAVENSYFLPIPGIVLVTSLHLFYQR